MRGVNGTNREDGMTVVAGGLVGQYGEFVSDSTSNPKEVVGGTNGCGKVFHEKHFGILSKAGEGS